MIADVLEMSVELYDICAYTKLFESMVSLRVTL